MTDRPHRSVLLSRTALRPWELASVLLMIGGICVATCLPLGARHAPILVAQADTP